MMAKMVDDSPTTDAPEVASDAEPTEEEDETTTATGETIEGEK